MGKESQEMETKLHTVHSPSIALSSQSVRLADTPTLTLLMDSWAYEL